MLRETATTEAPTADFKPPRAPRRPFTDRYLAALKAGPARYEVLDPARRGLLLRITPNGIKTFYFRYQRNLKPVRLMIGRYPAISLRLAYETHAELVKRLNRGEGLRVESPIGLRGLGLAAEPADAALTVGDLADEFSKRYLQRERNHPREAELVIEGNILRYWRHRATKSITRRDGVLLLDRVVDRNAPVMANRVAALLSQMFRFGVERGMLEASPFVSMPRPGGTEGSRRRKLDEREVRVFWKKLTRSRLNAEVRLALKLILVTAQRPGEVALAAWTEFDLLSQGIRDRRKYFSLPDFTPHDLRRTAASLMTASGVPRLHVEKVLNHTIDDVAEIYDRHSYSEEKRAALERLSQALKSNLRHRTGTSFRSGTSFGRVAKSNSRPAHYKSCALLQATPSDTAALRVTHWWGWPMPMRI